MPYYYDQWGFLTDTVLPQRATDVAPPTELPDGMAANWTGHKWVVIPYFPPLVYTPAPEVLLNPTRRQIKLALLQLGLLNEVEYAIANSGDRELQISYENALDFDRDSALVRMLAAALGKTDDEIDAVWALARTL